MQIPFKIDEAAKTFKVSPDMQIVDLMDDCEIGFQKESEKAGMPLDLQINVFWNVKDHKKALNPNDKLGQHFVSGESFGVYGDIQPMQVHPAKKAEEEKTPVTILTGFLGSGKTTLLNYILQEQTDKKIAIIENEFGEISIDDALLKQGKKTEMAEKIVVMDNGCMCCTIRGDLAKGLQEMIKAIKEGGTIDCIMIETTGMADPVPIVRTFMSDPSLTQDLRLDAVITMTDAKNLLGRLDDEVEEGKVNEAYQQVAFADKIILNKLDLITTEQAIAVKDRIRSINKFAKVIPAIKGRVKMDELANIRAHDMAFFVDADLEKEAEDVKDAHGHEGHSGHGGHGGHGGDGHAEDCAEEHGSGGHGGEGSGGHGGQAESGGHGGGHGGGSAGHAAGQGHTKTGHGENRHDQRVNSFAIVKEGEIIPKKLSMWMQALGQLPAERGTIFRIKAILAVKGHPFKHVFHAVMDISDEDDAGPWGEDEKRVSKIVFIGKSMDKPFLTRGFEDIFTE